MKAASDKVSGVKNKTSKNKLKESGDLNGSNMETVNSSMKVIKKKKKDKALINGDVEKSSLEHNSSSAKIKVKESQAQLKPEKKKKKRKLSECNDDTSKAADKSEEIDNNGKVCETA